MSMNKICCLWTYYVFCLAGILLISCTEDEVAGTPLSQSQSKNWLSVRAKARLYFIYNQTCLMK